MIAYLNTIARALLVAVALVGLSRPALAGRQNTEPTAANHTAAHAKPPEKAADDDFPLGGLLIIAGIVALLVFAAWLGSRMGDHGSHVVD